MMLTRPATESVIARSLGVVLFMLAVAPGCSRWSNGPSVPSAPRAFPLPEWEAAFRPPGSAWRGADACYSLELGGGKTLWLFGDTWITESDAKGREGGRFIRNSVAVQTQESGGPGCVAFFWRTDEESDGTHSPKALFAPVAGPGWFWPLSGLRLGDRLYLFMSRVVASDRGLGFESIGNVLLVVTNPDAPPDTWATEEHPVPFYTHSTNGDRTFGCANVTTTTDQNVRVYVYGYQEDWQRGIAGRSLIVARTTRDALERASLQTWEFFDGSGWTRHVDKAQGLFPEAAAEMSVHYHPGLGSFVAVYTRFGLSDEILGRCAPRPEGPWTEPALLYRCPDVHRNKRYFCYAAKAHPELSAADDDIIITYAVNSSRLGDHIEDMDLYWPRFIKVVGVDRGLFPFI